MIGTICEKCGRGVLVLGTPTQLSVFNLDKWEESFPCISVGCDGRAVRKIPTKNFQQMAPDQYYRALFGFGAGESEAASPEVVTTTLTGKRITGVKSRPIGQPVRTIVEALLFEDGTVLHLCSSNEGACVYLVEKP